jgi:hypothetical protein
LERFRGLAERLQDLLLMNNIYFFVDPTFPPTQPNEITFEIAQDKNIQYTEKEITIAVHWRKITSLLPAGKNETSGGMEKRKKGSGKYELRNTELKLISTREFLRGNEKEKFLNHTILVSHVN